MDFFFIMRHYTVNGMTYQHQKSFLEKTVYAIIREFVLRICSVMRFLTIRQYTFLDERHMRHNTFL